MVYSAFSTKLQIGGDLIVRSDNDIRITNLSIKESTNGAYETYNNKYTKDTTSMFVTLPSNSSITYEVEITNKDSIDYLVSKIDTLSNTNSNIDISVELKEKDLIDTNSTKIFTIIFVNNTSSEQETTLVLKYQFIENNFVVTLISDIFYMENKTINGVEIKYDPNTSIITFNGTTINTNFLQLYVIKDLTFKTGEIYDYELNYISGNISGNSYFSLVVDILTADGYNVSPRNNGRRNIFVSGRDDSFPLVTISTSVENGKSLKLRIWISGSTFICDNYQTVVKLYKKENISVKYGSIYGSLTIPKRDNFTFKCWNTSEDGSGECISDTSVFEKIEDQNLYAIWESNQ